MASTLTDEELDAVFSALAHRARRDVLQAIARHSEPPAMKELAAELEVSPQLLQKHLATLEKARLITRQKHGRETNAEAHPEVLAAANEWIAEMTSYWNDQLDSLQAYIDQLGLAVPTDSATETTNDTKDQE
ncbi:helix-turn-helix domain-containing protein [Pseudarthrobacter sp. J75]|uniref:ArsR/SmtB family transcription factor n=1 Tax=unclassified Pseudarthrobacter TaxID=2647000 RepID=UPI002E8154DF|nr:MULTISPECIES: helix-turn-helix domain-containing protein [unclassified Pseudarthrobacter]MEE2524095.1 helix-turn-helix domain-containing protein [Pseudarthrobacter sp. J47]MEE2530374.1 helix-turn-helix domain-containing protein [Pseudarthrobacter sp. J75]MEE2568854.1 helix-turn-helix domain-containing protein [Pseudarthrobacter sp. J64]